MQNLIHKPVGSSSMRYEFRVSAGRRDLKPAITSFCMYFYVSPLKLGTRASLKHAVCHLPQTWNYSWAVYCEVLFEGRGRNQTMRHYYSSQELTWYTFKTPTEHQKSIEKRINFERSVETHRTEWKWTHKKYKTYSVRTNQTLTTSARKKTQKTR